MSSQTHYEPGEGVNGTQVLLGEEVSNSKLTLFDVTKQICDAIQARGEQGKYHFRNALYWYSAHIRNTPVTGVVAASCVK